MSVLRSIVSKSQIQRVLGRVSMMQGCKTTRTSLFVTPRKRPSSLLGAEWNLFEQGTWHGSRNRGCGGNPACKGAPSAWNGASSGGNSKKRKGIRSLNIENLEGKERDAS